MVVLFWLRVVQATVVEILIVEMYRHQGCCKHGCQTGSFLNHMQTIFGALPFTVLKWGIIAAGIVFILCNLGDFCRIGSDPAIVYPLVQGGGHDGSALVAVRPSSVGNQCR